MFESLSALSGLFASIWISIGVFVVAKFYPNYDHKNQFCSELGASGSPTEKLSPIINNYPLSFIFGLFGWHLTQLNDANIALIFTGVLVILHGMGTWVAGYFPMDKDPYTKSPSLSCKIHSWAGFIMLLALLIAPIVVAFSPDSTYIPFEFRVFSIIVVSLAIFYLVKMAQGVKEHRLTGYYQRLSYWVKLLWLSVFSLLLI
jgi:hypothetical membrane protein